MNDLTPALRRTSAGVTSSISSAPSANKISADFDIFSEEQSKCFTKTVPGTIILGRTLKRGRNDNNRAAGSAIAQDDADVTGEHLSGK
jgi:hypothetical protein